MHALGCQAERAVLGGGAVPTFPALRPTRRIDGVLVEAAPEPVALSAEVPELIELLHEVRALLGDRAAS